MAERAGAELTVIEGRTQTRTTSVPCRRRGSSNTTRGRIAMESRDVRLLPRPRQQRTPWSRSENQVRWISGYCSTSGDRLSFDLTSG
jgi:hypothetical protein